MISIRSSVLFVFFLCCFLQSIGQSRLDSLMSEYGRTSELVAKLELCFIITETASFQDAEEIALEYSRKAQELLLEVDPKDNRQPYFKLMTEVGRALYTLKTSQRDTVAESRDSTLRASQSLAKKVLKDSKRYGVPYCEAWAYNILGMTYGSLLMPDSAKIWYLKSHQLAKRIEDKKLIAWTGFNLSEILGEQGSIVLAIKYLKYDLTYSKEIGDVYYEMESLGRIGELYTKLRDYEVALTYFRDSRIMATNLKKDKFIASTYKNIGLCFANMGELDSALVYNQMALAYGIDVDVFNNMGIVYRKKYEAGDSRPMLDSSLVYLKSAYKNLSADNLKSTSITCANLAAYFSHIADTENYRKWESKFKKSIDHAEALYYGDMYNLMGESCARLGLYKDAFNYSEMFKLINTSAHIKEQSRQAASVETEILFLQQIATDSLERVKEVFRREQEYAAEIRSSNQKRNFALTVGAFSLLISIGLLSRTQILRKSKAEIKKEKEEAERQRERSDDLLLNILPVKVAEELKEKGTSEAQHFKSATVLFTDFVGFTKLSQSLTPKELLTEINLCFSQFDRIMEKHGLEKIKTIGDAYMAAGGLPEPNNTHAFDVLKAAIEIQEYMEDMFKQKEAENKAFFKIRIGLHTGSLVAGIVGLKKFQYDIWGDTVNTASRMESAAEVGMVNMSKSSYEIVKSLAGYRFKSRGKIEAKGKGLLEMFCVVKAETQQ